jgi:hypothetical protein
MTDTTETLGTFLNPPLATEEIARCDYIYPFQRVLTAAGIDPNLARLGATDCWNSRFRADPIADACEWLKGWNEVSHVK